MKWKYDILTNETSFSRLSDKRSLGLCAAARRTKQLVEGTSGLIEDYLNGGKLSRCNFFAKFSLSKDLRASTSSKNTHIYAFHIVLVIAPPGLIYRRRIIITG